MENGAFLRGGSGAQRLLSKSSIFRGNVVLGYAVSLVAFITALVLRFLLDETLPPGFPFLTFIPAVIITAFIAGSRAGVLCAALSFVAVWYWFLGGGEPFSLTYGTALALGFFAFIAAVDIAIIEYAARALERFASQQAQLKIIVEKQHRTQNALEEALTIKELLLREVNHRVKNSLHLVNSFLFLEALKLDDGEAYSAVMAARSKVELIARVHQLLYESGKHNRVDMKTAIEEIVGDLVISAGRDDVNLEFSFSGDLAIKISQASPLVLVVNEIVTNSLKYGLNSKEPSLFVSAVKSSEEVTLVISDNGPGISPTTAEEKPSQGSEIIGGLVHQMRGEIIIQSASSGTTIVLRVPTDPESYDIKGTS